MTQIRSANESDVKDILYITKEAFKKYASDLGQPEKVMALKENEATILDELKRKTLLLGFYDGRAVGTVRFEKIPGNLAYITRFGVLPEAQKCGMGRLLISEVCARCAQEGITAVALHTCTKMFPLVRFYYGQGFYIHSTTQDRGYVRGLFLKELTGQTHETMDLNFVSKL